MMKLSDDGDSGNFFAGMFNGCLIELGLILALAVVAWLVHTVVR